MKEEKETKEKIIEINDKKENDDNLIIQNNSLYSDLSISQETNISFEQSKTQGCQTLSEDAFRCHLCKELMITRLKKDGENINVDYSCPNHHFGSLDINLFLNKFPFFSFIYQKCSKCGLKQRKTKELFYFCKDCKETYCQNHIKDCKLNKEKVVNVVDIDYLCLDHNKDYISYCEKCNENLCEICAASNKHKDHKKYLWYFKAKIIEQEENDKIDQYILQSITEKKRFETEIQKLAIKNLEEFLTVAMEFEEENAENTLEDFLEGITLSSDIDQTDDTEDSITLMTLHSAKGLEFPAVFLVGMEEGIFPGYKSINEPKLKRNLFLIKSTSNVSANSKHPSSY